MKKQEALQKSGLFFGIPPAQAERLLDCTGAAVRRFGRDEMVVWEGEAVTDIGILLSGRGQSVKIGPGGETQIITLLDPGSFIGILLAASRERKSPLSVQALSSLEVLFLPFQRVAEPCAKGCPEHRLLVRNCFDCVAEKSMVLHDRIHCLVQPTLRDKIRTLLEGMAPVEGGDFYLPMGRQAMAEYLGADRSALSRELSRMKKEGVLAYQKNRFRLL